MITIDGFEIDASITEQHSFRNEITEHPVESGADVTDHVRLLPQTVTITGIVTDTPIGSIATRRFPFSVPSSDALSKLETIRLNREPVTIETDLKTYENMVLESVEIPRNSSIGDALRFTATFKEIILVSNLRATIRVAVPRASSRVSRGAKATTSTGTSSYTVETVSRSEWLRNLD